jgi:TonB family protein
MIKIGIQIVLLTIVTFIYSCGNKSNNIAKKSIETISDTNTKKDSTNLPPFIPTLIWFKQSECKSNCKNFFQQTLSHDTLSLKFSSVLDCGVKYDLEIESKKDRTLHIKTINRTGVIEECYCLYVFELKIKHMPAKPKKLLVDGEPFNKSKLTFNNNLYSLTLESPTFPGGEEAFHTFIDQHLVYPDSSFKAKVEGTVYLNCVFNENGKIIECKILRGLNQELNDEACRLISMMPNWIIKENSSSFIYLPIKFKIEK